MSWKGIPVYLHRILSLLNAISLWREHIPDLQVWKGEIIKGAWYSSDAYVHLVCVQRLYATLIVLKWPLYIQMTSRCKKWMIKYCSSWLLGHHCSAPPVFTLWFCSHCYVGLCSSSSLRCGDFRAKRSSCLEHLCHRVLSFTQLFLRYIPVIDVLWKFSSRETDSALI